MTDKEWALYRDDLPKKERVMPNPNDPAMMAEKHQLGDQIDDVEDQIYDAEQAGQDTTALKEQLKTLEDQMQALQVRRKQARDAYRAANPPPGQQKK